MMAGVVVDGGSDDGDYGGYVCEEEYGTTPYYVRQQDSYNELVGTTAAITQNIVSMIDSLQLNGRQKTAV